MTDSAINPAPDEFSAATQFSQTLGNIEKQQNNLASTANGFGSAMTRAFTQATAGGKQLDSVLQSLALRVSSLAVSQAFKPIANSLATGITGGLTGLFNGIFGTSPAFGSGAIKPFASGGVIGTPTYFPLSSGGLGLAGEAGPEAIVPLSRGSDGRLGIAMSGAGQAANINVQIATPDLGSFRRSEAYLTGQIARAVARGQRSF
jgi:phage-related minor tail protein